MGDEVPGKARARARGRARTQQAPDTARRPGTEVTQQPPAGPPAGGTQPSAPAGSRRTHRGVPRTEGPTREELHGQSVPQLEAQMGSLELDAAARGRSRGREVERPTRPQTCSDKKGVSGQTIQLVANYFKVISKPNWCVYQYHVEFAPVVESRILRKALLYAHEKQIGTTLFDGMSDLKTLNRLPENTELFSQRRTDNETIRITFKFVAELAPSHPEIGRLFNTQMRKNLHHLKFQLLGRNYFDQEAISEIRQYNLQIWQGVVTSIRQMEDHLMLSVDTAHKVVRKETPLQILMKMASQDKGPSYREAAARELVGCIVMTRYNNKTYSIEDINWDLTPMDTFESRKEGPMRYVDYYQKHYDVRITDPKQPLLLCKSKEREIRGGASASKKIYLIPELCSMTGITDSMRNDFNFLKEMSVMTRVDPSKRVENLGVFMRRLNSNPQVREDMNKWGLQFDNELVRFSGRIVPPEKIIQRGKEMNYEQSKGDFSKETRGVPMLKAINLTNWILVCTRMDEPKAQDFLQNLARVCPPMGMQVRNPELLIIGQDRVNAYLDTYREKLTRDTQLVCFVVPNNKKERYDALKKHTCLETAVPSQVIVARTLSKKQMLMSVATKIGIQLNCKLGGEPWALEIPIKKRVMVIGYDTYHDSAKRGRSAGAFVASLNNTFTRWYSKVTFHSAGGWDELSSHITANLTAALHRYKEENGAFPELFLYYRDGVGDGSIPYVIDSEVKSVLSVMGQYLAPENQKLAFVVVNKKVNTRFFAPGQRGYSNPPPGTVIDNTVTRFDRYDFYLVSQSVRQGTVAPTMYNVIYDTSGLKPEHIQRFSYKLTHLYFNWPGTIRVPAPCQYAHKLAFLTGQSLHKEPHENLCDTLFYL